MSWLDQYFRNGPVCKAWGSWASRNGREPGKKANLPRFLTTGAAAGTSPWPRSEAGAATLAGSPDPGSGSGVGGSADPLSTPSCARMCVRSVGCWYSWRTGWSSGRSRRDRLRQRWPKTATSASRLILPENAGPARRGPGKSTMGSPAPYTAGAPPVHVSVTACDAQGVRAAPRSTHPPCDTLVPHRRDGTV